MWLTRSFVDLKGGTATVVDIDETYEAYLYTADADAWKEVYRLLMLYPGNQPAVYSNTFETAGLLAEFTKTGNGTAALSSTYAQGGTYSVKISGVFDGTYTKIVRAWSSTIEVVDCYLLLGTGTLPGAAGVYVDNAAGEQLASCYFSTTHMVAMNGSNDLGVVSPATWYHVRMELNNTAKTVNIWLDGVKVVTDQAFDLSHSADTTSSVRFQAAANDATYQGLFIDTESHGQYPMVDLYKPRKYFNVKCQHLGPSPYHKDEDVWKFTFKYNKLEVVT